MVSSWFFVACLAFIAFSAHGFTAPPTRTRVFTDPPTTAAEVGEKRKVVLIFVTEKGNDLDSNYAGGAALSAKATFDEGAFAFDDFNLHFSSVPTDLLTNDDGFSSSRSLGFSAARLGSVNATSDCRGLKARIEGSAHSSVYEALDLYRFFINSPNNESYYAPYQLVDATALVNVDSEEGDGNVLLDQLYNLSTTEPTNETFRIKFHIKIVLSISPSSAQRNFGILPLKIVVWKMIWVQILVVPSPSDLLASPFVLIKTPSLHPTRSN